MQAEAQSVHAEGIVGVDLHEGRYGWSPDVIEFFVVGTAIVPIRAEHNIPSPQLILSLND
jgi:uncharacterized protein YbjQ (UPF0145 family)